jgi:alkanesulfonate monooxygenase SsuD/methylene tetrahydromethanopterin reductase-like flavin-dependent oxidoreductase (luciferase family)
MMQAIEVYRESFRPSAQLSKPYVMLGFNVFAADTQEDAEFRATSMQQAFVNIRTGKPSKLPPPLKDYPHTVGAQGRALLDSVLSCSAIGAPDTVRAALKAFIARTGADELMITCQIFDHAQRLRSFEITSEIQREAAVTA